MPILKSKVKYGLQRLLGFERYLFIFSLFKIKTLKWDKMERDFFYFLRQIPNDSVVLDIGANIGIMTYFLSKVRPNVEVVAFEPMPQNIKALKKIIDHFDLQNVNLQEIALGDESGEVEMVMPVLEDVKMQGLSHVVHDSITTFNEGLKFKVPLQKLDDLQLLKSGKRISGIKMDVENFEYFVLKGGKELLKEHKPIVYTELWENENRDKCFELMQSIGYEIHVIEGDLTTIFDSSKHHTQNFIFLPANV